MTNKQLVIDFIEKVLNQKNLDLIDTYISKEFVNHSKNAIPGIDGVKKYFAMLENAFPDRQVTITQIITENDLVNIFTEWTGTHENTFLNLPATYKKVTVYTSDLYLIKSNKIVEHWDVVNNTEMMVSIGYDFKK